MATKRSEIELKSQYRIYKTATVKFRKDSGIFQAVCACAKEKGIPHTTYMLQAIVEKLQHDGYNPEDFKSIKIDEP